MAIVPLKFVPPAEDDILRLHIFEGDAVDGDFAEIDSVLAGIYPDYINEYTTTAATAADNWFSIQWENARGARSALSAPIRGGTTTLIGEIVERVMLRNPSLDENVVLQEAEATISWILKVKNPYSVDISTVSKLWLTELTNLTLVAALYIATLIQLNATATSYTVGMISESTSVNQSRIFDYIDKVEKRALRRLGIGGSLIAAIDTHEYMRPITGVRTRFDSSRLLSTRAIITEQVVERDLPSGLLVPTD